MDIGWFLEMRQALCMCGISGRASTLSRGVVLRQGSRWHSVAHTLFGGVTWAPDGKRIASTRYDGIVQIWDALEGDSAFSAGEELVVLHTSSYPNGVVWSPDGRLLASTSDDGTVQVWTTTWKNSAILDPHDRAGWTLAVTWSPDARLLAASRAGRLVQLWDVRTGREAITLDGHTDEVGSTAWSPDGLRLASGSDDGTVRVWGVP